MMILVMVLIRKSRDPEIVYIRLFQVKVMSRKVAVTRHCFTGRSLIQNGYKVHTKKSVQFVV
jgi:hypothetical protein